MEIFQKSSVKWEDETEFSIVYLLQDDYPLVKFALVITIIGKSMAIFYVATCVALPEGRFRASLQTAVISTNAVISCHIIIAMVHSNDFWWSYGYGSIPINTIFSGMNIHLPAIFGVHQGYKVLTHCHIFYAECMANFQQARLFSISPSLKSASGPPLSDQSIESSILVYEKHFNIPSGKQR